MSWINLSNRPDHLHVTEHWPPGGSGAIEASAVVRAPRETNILLGRKTRKQTERCGPGKTSAAAICQVFELRSLRYEQTG